MSCTGKIGTNGHVTYTRTHVVHKFIIFNEINGLAYARLTFPHAFMYILPFSLFYYISHKIITRQEFLRILANAAIPGLRKCDKHI